MFQTHRLKQKSLVHRTPMFYGWVVWAVATLGYIMTSPGQSYTVSLFIDHYIIDFSLDRTTVSGLYGLGTFIASLGLTWVGRKIDRYGNRTMGIVISGMFAIVLMALSFTKGPFTLILGFIAIRGLGQGSLALVSSTSVANWFSNRRGRMMGLTLVVFALFRSIYVPELQKLLEVMDWRQVWVILGVLVGVTILPAMALFMRTRPEMYGLQPDGAPQPEDTDELQEILTERNWTLAEAMQTAIFWVFLFGRILPPAFGTGIIFHQISIFTALGHEPLTAGTTYSTFSILSAGFALLFGFLVDRLRPNNIMVIQLGALMLTCFMATIMSEGWMLLVYSIAFGIVMGSGGVFDGAVWANLYGRLNQGAIRGFVTTAMVASTATGPIIFGFSYDNLGGYTPALMLGVALAATGLFLSLFVSKPPKRKRKSV